MKGLIIKEFYSSGKSMIIADVSVALLALALSFSPMPKLMLFFFWLLISIVIMYPAFSISADAEKGFHICAETLSVSKADIIISKFRASWILAVISVAMGFVGIMIHSSVYGGANIAEELKGTLFVLETGIIFGSLFQILTIKKIKVGSFIPALYGGMGHSVYSIAFELFGQFEKQGIILLIFGLLAVVSYIFSYFKCISVYEKGVIK